MNIKFNINNSGYNDNDLCIINISNKDGKTSIFWGGKA